MSWTSKTVDQLVAASSLLNVDAGYGAFVGSGDRIAAERVVDAIARIVNEDDFYEKDEWAVITGLIIGYFVSRGPSCSDQVVDMATTLAESFMSTT